MKRSFLKKAGALAVTLSMAVGLFAAPLPLQAAGKTETVYVMTKLSTVAQTGDDTEPFNVDPTTYTYTNKGLLKTSVTPWSTIKYKYSGKKLVGSEGIPAEDMGTEEGNTFKYTYDSKNRLKTATFNSTFSDGTKISYVTTYKYDKNNNVKSKTTVYNGDDSTPSTYYYSYNSKGQLIKETSSDSDLVKKYTYNNKGFVKKTVTTYTVDEKSEGFTENYTYTYTKQGNVKKCVKTIDYTDETMSQIVNETTYTYKKLTVKKSLADTIKQQQEKIYKDEIMTY